MRFTTKRLPCLLPARAVRQFDANKYPHYRANQNSSREHTSSISIPRAATSVATNTVTMPQFNLSMALYVEFVPFRLLNMRNECLVYAMFQKLRASSTANKYNSTGYFFSVSIKRASNLILCSLLSA